MAVLQNKRESYEQYTKKKFMLLRLYNDSHLLSSLSHIQLLNPAVARLRE